MIQKWTIAEELRIYSIELFICVQRIIQKNIWVARCWLIHYVYNATLLLSLNMWGPSYLILTRSVSWLLMPWLLVSPGHQQSWYWLCKIGKSWSYTKKDFNYLWPVSVEEWHKMLIHVYVSSEKFSTYKKLIVMYRWWRVYKCLLHSGWNKLVDILWWCFQNFMIENLKVQ